jgi:hypothetical protein
VASALEEAASGKQCSVGAQLLAITSQCSVMVSSLIRAS